MAPLKNPFLSSFLKRGIILRFLEINEDFLISDDAYSDRDDGSDRDHLASPIPTERPDRVTPLNLVGYFEVMF